MKNLPTSRTATSRVYDGTAHTKYEYKVTYGDETLDLTIKEGELFGTVTLSTGDVLTIRPDAKATITHVAETTVDNAFVRRGRAHEV